MKTFKKILLVCGVLLSLPAIASTETRLLMLAAELNVMKALAPRCNLLIPGYSEEFQVAYNAARKNSLDKAGITDAVLAEAETFPELSSASFPAKFDKRAEEQKKLFCKQHLQKLKAIANPDADNTQ